MSDIVIQAQNLTKYYGKKLALDHLNLSIPRGCVCGFLGRNGSGKTTAIKLMLGLLKPTAGSSAIFGIDSQQLSPSIRQRTGYVSEGHRLFVWMTIGEIKKYQRAFFPGQWDEEFFGEMLEYFGLSEKQTIKKLSNGQRAQVSLALTLAPNPELLIMDDPTLGLDAAVRHQFLEGIIQLVLREGRTIFFSSHILADVERVADRIVVIDKGILKAYCTIEQFRQSVKKVRISFSSSLPKEINIDGLLHYRYGDTEMELTLVGTPQQTIEEWIQANGARKYKFIEMSLEERFIEYTEPQGQKKLFSWETR
ncbi:MAG: ABC transporter ATP-binding protein [Planctomycetota bacterium]|jgi:ABC-2 type transport system ATP-binding protein